MGCQALLWAKGLGAPTFHTRGPRELHRPRQAPHTSSCTLSDGRLIGDPDSTTSQATRPADRTLWDPSCPDTPLGWHVVWLARSCRWSWRVHDRFKRAGPRLPEPPESAVSCEPGHLTAPPPTHPCTLPPSWSQGPKPTSGQELRGQSSRAGLGTQEKVHVERCSCLSTQGPAFVLGARSSLPRSEQRALL